MFLMLLFGGIGGIGEMGEMGGAERGTESTMVFEICSLFLDWLKKSTTTHISPNDTINHCILFFQLPHLFIPPAPSVLVAF